MKVYLKISEHLKIEVDGVLMFGIESAHLVQVAVEFDDFRNQIKYRKIHLYPLQLFEF
jgi:hypothetical protein